MKRRPWESSQHAKYYLLGVYLSDGSLCGPKKCFRLSVRDQEFRDTAAAALDLLKIAHSCREHYRKERVIFDGKSRSKGGTIFRVRAFVSPEGRELSRWLMSSTQNKESLPPIPSECFPELVAGVLDGDGCVSVTKRKGRPRIIISGKCGYLSKLIKELQKFGVRVQGPYINNTEVPMYRPNPRDFVDRGLFFRLSRKQKKLEAAVGATRRH